MTLSLFFVQVPPGERLSAWGMIVNDNLSTQLILGVLAVFSFISWVILLWKFFQFRRLWKEADRFLDEIESAQRLEDAYRSILSLPESPFSRV
ncbi:MAG: hypothetical protein M3418_00965, partial [Gemmatimonadota bacterium]|nr:hypothetical protein [Gemmatimonadota bacterium]